MKKLLLTIIGVCVLCCSNLYAETIKLTAGEWDPYISKNLKHYGFVSHIVTDVFKDAGIDVEYGFFPWKRSYHLASEGEEWHGSIIWGKSDERAEKFLFTEPVLETTSVLFHKKDNELEWETYKDLSNIKIGATLEYFYGDEFKKAEENKVINVERVPTDEQNFKKLLAGRIDAFNVDLDVAFSLLNKSFTQEERDSLTYNKRPITKDSSYLLISKKAPNAEELVKKFNKSFKKLKAAGKIDKYFENSRKGEYKK